MPVWHEFTREMRAEGVLRIVGIVQEQHPDRALLYQAWQGFGWPILWDPFDLTGSTAVPRKVFVDEFGVVRKVNPSMHRFEENYMLVDFEPPDGETGDLEAPERLEGLERLVPLDNERLGTLDREYYTALSDFLWRRVDRYDAALEVLDRHAREFPRDAMLAFRAGVAHRLRYDSTATRPDDFQAALDGWTRALALQPNQYIWRRRIQQYGPRLDKPYPFYTWIEEAQEALRARGVTPPALVASLTPAELAFRDDRGKAPGEGTAEETAEAVAPDPDGKIRRDEGLVQVETAVAFQTKGDRHTASVHVAFRPVAAKGAHWNNEAEPMRVWFEAPDLPRGWTLDARLLEHPPPPAAVSDEVRRFSVELRLPGDLGGTLLRGYALFNACEGENGTCLFLRRDFEVLVRRPKTR